ncbi:MAG: hypothetical protein ACFE9Q_09500 [Candidatus Hodarchaeota archaeon]
MSAILIEFMVFISLIGYCFVIANALIGISNIRDLNNMKGDVILIKFHKWYGRIEIFIFYVVAVLCLIMLDSYIKSNNPYLFTPSGLWAHTWIGGFSALVLVSLKFTIALFKKDEIYKYGHIIGPLGVIGWSLSYWTSVFNYYDAKINFYPITLHLIPDSFLWTAIIPFLGGICLYLIALFKRSLRGKSEKLRNLHGVSMILHGITFGYEGSAKELIGTPVLYKYVFPKTYEFLERYAEKIGLNMQELKNRNLNEAMEMAMRKFEKIGMAEKLKIKWISENEFTVESINCSTSVVRSYMKSEELVSSICPWGILAATIANSLTGKNIELSPSEFNEIGAITKLKITEKET